MGPSAQAAPSPPAASLGRRTSRAGALGGIAGVALAAALAVASSGCRRELDMARIYDQERAATTVRYLGVRAETRLYPDYGAIDGRILSPEGARGAASRSKP